MKKLFLLDAYALIYRAHFAFIKRPLINSQGVNTSAIQGFLNTLFDVLNKENPSHLAVAFDLPTPTFRHEYYPEYKAGREKQPEDITLAIPLIHKILEAFPIPILSCESYEADDVIGTIAKQAEKEGYEVYMMTPDKDYAQLVSDSVFLYKPAHIGNEIKKLGKTEILADWGITDPLQVIDMLGLQGDAVDNIPGVKGIGPKSAQALLAEFGSIENIYENLDKLKGKQKEQLERDKENAFLSKRLATIDLNVPMTFNEAEYHLDRIDKQAVLEIFKELELRTLSDRFIKYHQARTKELLQNEDVQKDLFGNVIETAQILEKAAPTPHRIVDKNSTNVEHSYLLMDTPEKQQELAALLAQQKSFAFDTETTGLDIHTSELVGISFSWEAHKAYYVPVPKEGAQTVVNQFKTVLENPNIAKVGQNIKFDMSMFFNYNVQVQGTLLDTMLMHYILEPDKRHGMDYLSETYLKYAPISIETLIGKKGKNQLTMRDIDIEKVAEYAAEDADVTWQLYENLYPKLTGDLLSLYQDVEAPLVEVLSEMEYTGVKIHSEFLNEYNAILQKEMDIVQKSIFEAAGTKSFNLDSPKQVGDILFEKLKIPYRWSKTSKTKQYSTDEEKLAELAEEYPIVQNLLTYRQLAKLKSTYIEALPLLVNPKTGRVHSSFNQALTSTGRLSSQNPNLQNIPIRSERGKEIRKAFVPTSADHVLLAADYSQIELRLMAAISGDAAMVEAFQKGLDIHTATAAKIYNVAIEDVTKEQRYAAKTVNFSIIYGAGALNLSRQLDIKRADATILIEQYFQQYSGLKTYMDSIVAKAREQGYVTTLCGRRRYLRDIHSQNSLTRSHAERNAVNNPIQGTAADMIKLAMIAIHKELKDKNLKTKLILQVHDELLFDVPKSELDIVRPLIELHMKNALPNLSVPIEVGIGIGDNWLEAH